MRVQQAARHFTYPPTPDISSRIYTPTQRSFAPRRLVQLVAALVLVVLLSMFLVPEIRASVLEFLRLGAVRILQIEPTATITPPPNSILALPNETTLEAAREQVDFQVLMPAYPQDVGLPDRVFVQNGISDMVSLVWLEPDQPHQIQFSLHILNSHGFAEKGYIENIEETTVNSLWAVWMTDPHWFVYEPNSTQVRWFIQHNVLLWEAGRLTYRVEGNITLEEARLIAESLE